MEWRVVGRWLGEEGRIESGKERVGEVEAGGAEEGSNRGEGTHTHPGALFNPTHQAHAVGEDETAEPTKNPHALKPSRRYLTAAEQAEARRAEERDGVSHQRVKVGKLYP
jgi:hypothetical protein